MFKWLREPGGSGLDQIEELFVRMLTDGRHVFDVAMSARVGGADPSTLVDDLNATEERTDEGEREIRRRLLVHASVRGTADIPACLMYMSIAKDAERIADLSKNLFGIAESVGEPPPEGPLRDDLVALKDEISPMISEVAQVFVEGDDAAAGVLLERARSLADHCREEISRLLGGADVPQPVATALTYRQLSRILANLLNILSAVVMPLDQLDYPELEGD
jgi:phosphate uptake regulator